MHAHRPVVSTCRILPALIFVAFLLWGDGLSHADQYNVEFGAAVHAYAFNGTWENRYNFEFENYRAELKNLFSVIAVANAGKMVRMRPSRDSFFWDDLDTMLEWSEQNGMKFKYHTLLWGSSVPAWLDSLADYGTQSEVRDTLEEHVRTIVSRYRGRIAMYDVVNEPLHRGDSTDYMGSGWTTLEMLVHAFTWAHEEDPDAVLLINEFYVLGDNVNSYYVLNEYIDLINAALDAGAPIDGIGIQAHLGIIDDSHVLDDALINASLDALHDQTGLPLYITEFDICAPGNELVGDWCPGDVSAPFEGFSDWWEYQAWAEPHVYEIFKNHPAVRSVIRWLYFDPFDQNIASLFDIDFNPRPVYEPLKAVMLADDQTDPPEIASVTIDPDSGTITIGDSVRVTVTAVGDEAGLTASDAQLNGVAVPLSGNGDGTYTGVYVVEPDHALGENIEATDVTLTGPGGTSESASSTGSTLRIVEPTGVLEDPRPEEIRLYQNTPNPFNPFTTITYSIPAGIADRIVLAIFDVKGAVIRRFVSEADSHGGSYTTVWDGRTGAGEVAASGIYFYQVTVGNHRSRINKMMLVR